MFPVSCVQWMELLLLLAPTQSRPAIASPDDLANQRQVVVVQLRHDPASALPAASDLFERWVRQDPDNRALRGFDDRLRALQTLRGRICDALEPAAQAAARSLAVDIFTNAPAAPQTQPALAGTDLVPAGQLYSDFLPHFLYRLDTRGLDPVQQDFLRLYYNAQVRRMIDDVMRLGMPLSAMAADSHELEYYLLLMPLLHSTSGFDVSLLSTLPPWIMAPDRLERLADFCLLNVGRLDAALAIGTRLLNQGKVAGAYEFCLAAADKCVKNRLPGRAVQCLDTAIASLPKGDSRAVDQRFAICQVWGDAKNYAMAAGQAGQIIKDLAGTPNGGRARYQRIKYLSLQGDAKAILLEADDALKDEHCKPFEPEMMFLKWSALRKEGKGEQAGSLLKEFLQKYPENILAADMYYAVAVDCLSAQRYDEAQGILQSLMDRFPTSKPAAHAGALLKRLAGSPGLRAQERGSQQPQPQLQPPAPHAR